MGRIWSPISISRWLGFDFWVWARHSSSSIFRWPHLDLSVLTPNWAMFSRWPDVEFSVVDSVLWSFVTAFESVALVSMLCFFFIFCGCNI
ncbi:hypothetical protein AAC387_Pa03g1931 [Persea americana]